MGRRKMPNVDRRADIFLLGITFFEMLTGELPFENIGLIVKTDELAPYPSQLNSAVSPELDKIVLRMLNKRTAERYTSACDVSLALDEVTLPADWEKRKLGVLLGCLVLLVLGVMAAAAVLLGQAWLT
jgi:serine/threonine protein kinase